MRAARSLRTELANARQGESVFHYVLVSERGQVVEDFTGLLFESAAFSAMALTRLGFGECFCHNVVFFRWLLLFGLIDKVV